MDDPATLVGLGDLRRPEPLLALVGLVAMFALVERRVRGAVVLGMLGVTAVGLALGVSPWRGLASAPPDLRPTLLALDLRAALSLALAPVVFTLLFVDLFDTAGTLVGVAHRARLLDRDGRLPRVGRALLADSTATAAGALLGTSTTTSYIESAAGVEAGGRTGLVPCTVAALFLLCLFFAPLAQTVPAYATAPALLYVACLMARALAELDWSDATEYGPGVLVALGIPLTSSISDGIGLGFIAFAAVKWASGRRRECPPAALAIALLFALRFALL